MPTTAPLNRPAIRPPERAGPRRDASSAGWINSAGAACISNDGPPAWRMAHAIAARHGRTPASRQELLAEAGLALAECAHRYEHGRGTKLSTYAWHRMNGRARETVRAQMRREATHAAYDRLGPELRQDTAPISAAIDVRGALLAAGDRLDRFDRLLLDRRYWQDRGFPEIAAELRWSVDKTRRRHGRLIGRLRQALGLVPAGQAEGGGRWRLGAQVAARASQKRAKITPRGRDLP